MFFGVRFYALRRALCCACNINPSKSPKNGKNQIFSEFFSEKPRKTVESVRIVLSGKLKIEYLRKGNRSLLREDGKVTILYDGRRCWSNGTIGGNDATWIFQFLFALRPVPELFGNLKLFPEPDGDTCTLLGRRDRYLTTALIAVNRKTGLWESLSVLHDGSTRRISPTGFFVSEGRNIPEGLLIDGEPFKVEKVEWNPPLADILTQFVILHLATFLPIWFPLAPYSHPIVITRCAISFPSLFLVDMKVAKVCIDDTF